MTSPPSAERGGGCLVGLLFPVQWKRFDRQSLPSGTRNSVPVTVTFEVVPSVLAVRALERELGRGAHDVQRCCRSATAP